MSKPFNALEEILLGIHRNEVRSYADNLLTSDKFWHIAKTEPLDAIALITQAIARCNNTADKKHIIETLVERNQFWMLCAQERGYTILDKFLECLETHLYGEINVIKNIALKILDHNAIWSKDGELARKNNLLSRVFRNVDQSWQHTFANSTLRNPLALKLVMQHEKKKLFADIVRASSKSNSYHDFKDCYSGMPYSIYTGEEEGSGSGYVIIDAPYPVFDSEENKSLRPDGGDITIVATDQSVFILDGTTEYQLPSQAYKAWREEEMHAKKECVEFHQRIMEMLDTAMCHDNVSSMLKHRLERAKINCSKSIGYLNSTSPRFNSPKLTS